MADKEEEGANSTCEEGVKTAETPESTTNEEAPQSLEPACPDTSQPSAEIPAPPAKDKKIEVLLKATGDAPIMGKRKWMVNPDQTVARVSDFIKKCIKLGSEDRLFLYINQTFAPAPDQTIKNLYECYGTDGKLIIHYCKSQAWG